VPGNRIPTELRNEIFFTLLRPVFKSLLPEFCRAGENVQFQVIFPDILKTREYNPQLQNQLLSYLTISIKLLDQENACEPFENIPLIYEPFVNEGSRDVIFLYKFNVKKTGSHELSIKYHNVDIEGTPYLKHFYSGPLDPSQVIN